jgi:hypothetical protein
MKKKILLGSIFAVVILIFLSFNNVVGYRNSNINLVHSSPLFDIRTNRAIEQDINPYFNDYIGKGEENKIYFPVRDNEKELLYKYIEVISQMDKKAFNNLKTTVISQVYKDEELRELGILNVLLAINLMRMYPDEIKGYIQSEGEVRPQFIIFTLIMCIILGSLFLIIWFIILIIKDIMNFTSECGPTLFCTTYVDGC